MDINTRDVDAIETLRIREIADAPLPAYYGRVKSKAVCLSHAILLSLIWVLAVTSIVFGYFKVGRRNNILDVVDVETVSVLGLFSPPPESHRFSTATFHTRRSRLVARCPVGNA